MQLQRIFRFLETGSDSGYAGRQTGNLSDADSPFQKHLEEGKINISGKDVHRLFFFVYMHLNNLYIQL
jgi:hypothetical protein